MKPTTPAGVLVAARTQVEQRHPHDPIDFGSERPPPFNADVSALCFYDVIMIRRATKEENCRP